MSDGLPIVPIFSESLLANSSNGTSVDVSLNVSAPSDKTSASNARLMQIELEKRHVHDFVVTLATKSEANMRKRKRSDTGRPQIFTEHMLSNTSGNS